MQFWDVLLYDYTSRQFSDPADKLFAISGTTEYIGEVLGLTYITGLWKEFFAESLLWYVGGDYRIESDKPSPLKPRPKDYRAPSWSRAAVDGPCQLWHMALCEMSQRLELLEIIPTTITTLVYSAHQATTLKVRGRLRRCLPAEVSKGSERGFIQGFHRKSPRKYTNIDMNRASEAGEEFGRLQISFSGHRLFVFQTPQKRRVSSKPAFGACW